MIQKIALLILCICVCAVGVLAATFGYETPGAANVNGTIEGVINCGKFSPASSGTATNISWYTTSSGTENSKGAIYEYVSDTDAGAFLAESSEDAGAADANWRTGTITYSLVSGTNYFLCAWGASGVGTNLQHYETTGGIQVEDTASYGTWPDPLVEATTQSFKMSIYVTYTETATGQPRIFGGGLIE